MPDVPHAVSSEANRAEGRLRTDGVRHTVLLMRHARGIGSERSALATQEVGAISDAQSEAGFALEDRHPQEDVEEQPLGWLISLLVEENARQS